VTKTYQDVNYKTLPDGRTLIHWLVADEAGPITTVGMPPLMTPGGPIRLGGGKWRVACNPTQNTINPQVRNGVRYMCMTSDDVRAATCPKCLATAEALELLDKLGESDLVKTLEGLNKLDGKQAEVAVK
jgi:hypothetical protein